MKKLIIAAGILSAVVLTAFTLTLFSSREEKADSVISQPAPSAVPTTAEEANRLIITDHWTYLAIETHGADTYLVYQWGPNFQRGKALITGETLKKVEALKAFETVNVEYIQTDGPIQVIDLEKITIRGPCSGPKACD